MRDAASRLSSGHDVESPHAELANLDVRHRCEAYDEQRQTLASDWNATVRAGCRVTLRQFAAKHGLKYETWRREYRRSATGAAVPDPKDRRRRKYAEYDPA